MKEQSLKYSLIFDYNQLAVCLPQPQGFKVLAICRIWKSLSVHVLLCPEMIISVTWSILKSKQLEKATTEIYLLKSPASNFCLR